MKIAVACMNQQTVNAHFGRAEKYMVFEVSGGRITSRNQVPKLGHRHFSQGQPVGGQGHGRASGLGLRAGHKHEQMIENIRDCDVLLTGGMGRGAYMDLKSWGITPIVTDITEVEEAVKAVLDGTIVDHLEKPH